jgi:ribokinase
VTGQQDHRTFYAYTPDGRRHDTDPAAHYARTGRPLPAELAGYVNSTPAQDDPAHYEPLALRPEDWPAAYGGASAVHLAPSPLASHLHAPARLRQAGVRWITVDPGERYMIPGRAAEIRALLPQVDAFLPSEQEVRTLFGADAGGWDAAEQLCDWGAPLVVIKQGGRGVLILEGSGGRRTHLSAFHTSGDLRIAGSTGAGDAFCGGFASGLALGASADECGRMGVVSASLVMETTGALAALSIRAELARDRLAQVRDRDV